MAGKVFTGLLWRRSEPDSAAPFGAAGSRRFLEWLAGQTGRRGLTPHGLDAYDRAVKELEPLAPKSSALMRFPVAIEAAGWYGYGLADFLTNELGCRVLLCVDRAHPKKPERPICEEFYEDVGRWELVELMKAFGARLVFGSSNVRSDDNWDYIPFFAPVWRTEEPIGALLGYEGCTDHCESAAEACGGGAMKKRIALYGKGGIGKTTVAVNTALCMAPARVPGSAGRMRSKAGYDTPFDKATADLHFGAVRWAVRAVFAGRADRQPAAQSVVLRSRRPETGRWMRGAGIAIAERA